MYQWKYVPKLFFKNWYFGWWLFSHINSIHIHTGGLETNLLNYLLAYKTYIYCCMSYIYNLRVHCIFLRSNKVLVILATTVFEVLYGLVLWVGYTIFFELYCVSWFYTDTTATNGCDLNVEFVLYIWIGSIYKCSLFVKQLKNYCICMCRWSFVLWLMTLNGKVWSVHIKKRRIQHVFVWLGVTSDDISVCYHDLYHLTCILSIRLIASLLYNLN